MGSRMGGIDIWLALIVAQFDRRRTLLCEAGER